MARFLTQEWIDEFNAALDGVDLPLPGPGAGLAVEQGSFVVAEEVRDAPEGDLRVTLRVEGGRLQLARRAMADQETPDEDDEAADVTIALSYHDAVALSAGELTPADALTAGRIRVRGDLSVLVAGQSMLDAARERTPEVSARTTY